MSLSQVKNPGITKGTVSHYATIYLALHFINAYALLKSIGYILRAEYNKKEYI
jgi:hypothetical protein